ncbi:hypothetical protein A2348_00015 [Candidatus Uhrbacteria bacterium RIFOXYB12_FULL_58_10]|uniref:Glutamate--cysteine ligase n=1 Tax=Candidatus Uhrbacteria bacterium RIFOXYB2_FULL_57_15 TaxID=1802422 RepID=A0A1F7W5N0_9BACT|nr:MAG: hypothetical protein A2348_00015 [Candidatus Uhrbacteria bacterium RIFOXYB12_FULL_58_10]OGL98123.1 MAG: hypothetical protein A2304_03520 [Candidatus Uhrbacteria bacterium RIFOXYB2_FULL_57_15]
MPDRTGSLLSRVNFDPSLREHFGVEREFFLKQFKYVGDCGFGWGPYWTHDYRIVPRSSDFLSTVNDPAWTYELSACQVEHRTDPSREITDIRDALTSGLDRGHLAAKSLDLRLEAIEVAARDMPLDVYPHDARYASIAAALPERVLSAACRVAGTHLHVGCASPEEALAVHNALVPHLNPLIALGDHSRGERIELYKMMARNWQPPAYASREHFDAVAREQGFATNLRDCWHLIRISGHGTVELRMFGVTNNVDEIINWILVVRGILRSI